MSKTEVLISTIVAIWFSSCILSFSYAIGLWPKSITKRLSALKKSISNKWKTLVDSIINDNVRLSFWLLIITILVFASLIFYQKPEFSEFIEGIQVELFGIIFDVLLLVLLFNWITKKGEKNRRIETYLNEIEDFRTWNSEESKYRIIGNIKRLNREGVSKFNLWETKLSGTNNSNKGTTKLNNLNFKDSKLLQSEFEYCNLFESNFSNTTCHYTKFNESILHKSSFVDSHLQGAEFKNCSLSGADFTNATITDKVVFDGADLRGVKFYYTTFNTASFQDVEVSASFIEELKKWKIKGDKVFNDYLFVKRPIQGREGKYRYTLIRKTVMTEFLKTEHTKLDEVNY